MPLKDQTPSTYLPTVRDFLTHWDKVNAEEEVLTLTGGFDRDDLEIDLLLLSEHVQALIPLENNRAFAAADRDIAKGQLVSVVAAFNRAVRDRLAGSVYTK